MNKRKPIFGVGVNDANYITQDAKNGFICPFYARWKHMIERCYSKKEHKRKPNYAKCSVCEEWLTFSNFNAWMEKQDWQGKHLDKDIIKIGNTIYCPEYCAFVTAELNNFILERESSRGDFLIGVTKRKGCATFMARCKDPFGGTDYIGAFNDETSAHNAWRERKHEIACRLASIQKDPRVANSLVQRYL